MPLSVLSPYAAPFVPGAAAPDDPGEEGQPNPPAPSDQNESPRPEETPDLGLWMWGDSGAQMMPLLSQPPHLNSAPFFLASSPVTQLPPFLSPYSVPFQGPAMFGPCGFGPPPPPHGGPPFPLCSIPPTGGAGGGKRRKRRTRQAAGRAQENGVKPSEAPVDSAPKVNPKRRDNEPSSAYRALRQKLFRESAAQTDFPKTISERTLQMLPSLLFKAPALPMRISLDRCVIASTTPIGRTLSTATDADLLLPPPSPSPPQPPPSLPTRVNYAAAVKSPAPSRAPLAAPAPPAPAPTSALSEKPQKGAVSGLAKRKGRKKAKAPNIDLEAVMAEQEAERASAVLRTALPAAPVKTEKSDGDAEEAAVGRTEFPGLLPSGTTRKTAEKIFNAWNTANQRTQSSSHPFHPSSSVTFADFVARKPQRMPQQRQQEIEQQQEQEQLQKQQRQQLQKQQERQRQEQQSNSVKTRVKFRPLFTIGGGSTQAPLFRPKDPPPLPNAAVELEWPQTPSSVTPLSLLKTKKSNFESAKTKKAANPLDSTGVAKRGKERENPKPKRPSLMKKIILRERLERRKAREQASLESGHQSCPENGNSDSNSDAEDFDDGACSAPEDSTREPPTAAENHTNREENETAAETSGTAAASLTGKELREEPTTTECEETTATTTVEDEVPNNWESLVDPESSTTNDERLATETLCCLHSRRFREYCNQMIGKDINECVLAILADLVRFQDRLHQRDPVRAKQRRRLVCGLKEVTKHLRLKRLKLVIVSPDVERIESKGGLDDAVRTILELCEANGTPYVFSLPRRLLGRACLKPVPIAVVGIFNYEGTEQHVRRLTGLVEEGRAQYRLVARIAQAKDPEGTPARATGHARTPSEPISELGLGD